MRFEGIHHVTAITGDAPGNVDFYTRLLGLRLVKKTVNQDDPTVYHLFYADERGSRRQRHHVLRVSRRRPRAGPARAWCTRSSSESPRRTRWRSGTTAERRRAGAGARGGPGHIRRPRGASAELEIDASGDQPLVAEHPEIPPEHAIRGFAGVRAYAADAEHGRDFLEQTLASSRTARRTGRSAASTAARSTPATRRPQIEG